MFNLARQKGSVLLMNKFLNIQKSGGKFSDWRPFGRLETQYPALQSSLEKEVGLGGLNCWSIHRRELGKQVQELFQSRRIQWRPAKGLAPNSEAAGLQSLLVSENCFNIKSTDKPKWGLCSNIDMWGLENCKRKEGNKNGYTLRVSLFY